MNESQRIVVLTVLVCAAVAAPANAAIRPFGVLNDLTVIGSLSGGGDLGAVDLVYRHDLSPGDANRDFRFDQQDIVQVLQAGKYLTGQPATWGEGDWNGGPGGYAAEPPRGDGTFNQQDIVAALQSGTYLTGAYAAISAGGQIGDEQTTIIYNAITGEIAVDAPASTELTSINIDSAAAIFTGDPPMNINPFGCCSDNNLFKATFGGSFGSLSFGNVAQTGLSRDFVLNDLTVIGSLAGGGDLGAVDLIYVPEPSTWLLLSMAAVGFTVFAR